MSAHCDVDITTCVLGGVSVCEEVQAVNIAFVADKGGVGKSTLAYHCAVRLQQLGREICLIDLDRRGASSGWLRATDPPRLPTYIADDVLGRMPAETTRVWDTPAHPNAKLRDSLAAGCDLLVVVALTDRESHIAAAELCQQLLGEGASAAILINAVRPTSSIGEQAVEAFRAADLPCFRTIVRQYACYQHAQWDRLAICDQAYPSADKAWADICAMTDEALALAAAATGSQTGPG